MANEFDQSHRAYNVIWCNPNACHMGGLDRPPEPPGAQKCSEGVAVLLDRWRRMAPPW